MAKDTPYPVNELERRLIQECLEQDRHAQKELYDRYKDAMYTLCVRITGDQELGADVLQEAFISVFQGLAQFKYRSTLGAWIKTIVVRAAYKKIRKEPQFAPVEEIPDEGYIDWGNYLEAAYLERAINELPDGYRTVFVLIEVEGYTHKDVGKMLNISPGTSKSQLHYAKKLLRKKLNHLLQIQ